MSSSRARQRRPKSRSPAPKEGAASAATGAGARHSVSDTSAAAPALPALFDYSHIDGLLWVGPWLRPWQWRFHVRPDWRLLLVAAWAPFGLALLCARLAVFFVSALFLAVAPERPAVRAYRAALPLLLTLTGWIVQVRVVHPGRAEGSAAAMSEAEAVAQLASSGEIIACNHRTATDILPFLKRLHSNVLLDAGFYGANAFVRQFLAVVGAIPIADGSAGAATAEVRAATRAAIERHLATASHPLVFFPEGWDSNGRVGLLRFNRFLFGLGRRVVPAALRVSSPLPLVRPGVLGSSALRELLWFFWAPWTTFTISVLPAMRARAGEAPEGFAGRVQGAIASELGLVATPYAKAECLEWRRVLMGARGREALLAAAAGDADVQWREPREAAE